MIREELLERLQSIEWDDIEFKEARDAVPESALSSVSAFANTAGGYLVFGVKEDNGTITITGVIDAHKVRNAFLEQVRDDERISVFLPIESKIHDFDEGTVIVFHIPEADRIKKPVFLDGNLYNTYIRRGERGDRCTHGELIRLIRDAATEPDRYDAELLDIDILKCFDPISVRWYRERFAASNPGSNRAGRDNDFLYQRGFLIEREGRLLPTRAAILIFGADAYIRQVLSRMVVDLQFYRHTAEQYSSGARWSDRLVVEENLIKAWHAMLDFYFRHSERPFSINAVTLRRNDDPPDYISFREAAINLLTHQDFSYVNRIPVIRLFRDRSEFSNPGDMFSSREELLDPGEKYIRNPKVVDAFRSIGLSNGGGTGIRIISKNWRTLGFIPPEIDNNKKEKMFRLRLYKERLVSEAHILARASLGISLSEREAAVFYYLIRKIQIDLADIRALTGMGDMDARSLAQRLVAEGILKRMGNSPKHFALTEDMRIRFAQAAKENLHAIAR
ncbi:RNA-binding domain-containing protein [Thioalkalivibrio sp. HK1]|uniref:RNA-binding domain-containing protein n=1 Tax=Thioalkalivibrio sp. HK1 TaxID=1469245 RepID=UPI00046FD33E|nr:RNA-binding domain-containing protein [Thioalkalivibrio sp. HK1]